jgi:hypothetical protein
VHVRPPEQLPEDLEVAVCPQVARELVDREVEAHAVGHAVDRGEAQARGGEVARAVVEERLLDAHLLLGVEGDGAQLAGLVDGHGGVGHAPVVRARGREHEPPHAEAARVLDEGAAALHVHRVGGLGVARARRVADDGGEVHDGLHPLERALARRRVADVAADQRHAARLEGAGDVLLAVQEHVEHAHVVPAGQQLVDDESAHVAGAAGDDHAAHRRPALLSEVTPDFRDGPALPWIGRAIRGTEPSRSMERRGDGVVMPERLGVEPRSVRRLPPSRPALSGHDVCTCPAPGVSLPWSPGGAIRLAGPIPTWRSEAR